METEIYVSDAETIDSQRTEISLQEFIKGENIKVTCLLGAGPSQSSMMSKPIFV